MSDTQGFPEPTLTILAMQLYMQAQISLGAYPNPMTQNVEVNLTQAKHSIDVLDMLFEKTQGNRTNEETGDIERMIHELKMAYVEKQNA